MIRRPEPADWQADTMAILRAMNTSGCRFAHRLLPVSVAITAFMLMSACSQQAPTPPAAPSASAQAAANDAAAAKELKLYQDMLAQKAESLAAPVGKDILQKYPGTPAAAEVQKTLAQVEATAKSGPLIIDEFDATIVVPPDAKVWRDRTGNIVMELGGGA